MSRSKTARTISSKKTNKMKNSLKEQCFSARYIWVGAFLAIFVVLFFFQCIFPAQSDDYSHYFKAINPELGFLHSYFHWNGRIGEILYVGFFARFNNSVWLDLLGAFMGSAFVLVFFMLIFARLPRDARDVMYLCFLCFCLITFNDFAANFLWNSGYFNYLFGCLLIMLFWLPFRYFWQKILRGHQGLAMQRSARMLWLFLAPLSFFAGMGSEQMGVYSIIMAVMMLVYAWYMGVRLPVAGYLSFMCFLAGYLCLYFSPGSAFRTLVSKDSFISFSALLDRGFLDSLWLFFSSFNHLYAKSFAVFLIAFIFFYLERLKAKWYFYIFGILCGIMALVVARHLAGLVVYGIVFVMFLRLARIDSKFYAFGALFLSWVLIGAIVFQLPLGLPKRAQLGGNLILYTLLLGMFLDFYARCSFKIWLKRLVFISLILSTIACMLNWGYMGYKWHKMESYIAYKKSLGAKEVVIPWDNFVGFYHSDWGLPSTKADFWVNELYAKHYGLERFIVGDNKEFRHFSAH